MPVYARKVSTKDPRFIGREIQLVSADEARIDITTIPVPNAVVICNGCNENLYPGDGYLVYLGKRELQKDTPYDIYCEKCLKKYFPKAVIVE